MIVCVKKYNYFMMVIIILLIIYGCQPIARLTIVDISDPEHPVICLSKDPHCIGILSSMTHVSILEVNSSNRQIKEMWWLHKIDSKEKFVAKYGIPPRGWEETKPALPLEMNKIYQVNGNYYFSIYKKNNIVKSIVSRHLETVHNKLTEK